MDMEILIVTHKNFEAPFEEINESKIYIPILVGNNVSELSYQKFYRDNVYDNISNKNKNYCELTAQYWMWKNLRVDIVGLVHYRRYFVDNTNNCLANGIDIRKIIEAGMIITPKSQFLYGDTVWSQYKRNHNIDDLKIIRKIIKRDYHEYLNDFDTFMNKKKFYMYNMFIMSDYDFKNYSEWLFAILDKSEFEISQNIKHYDNYQSRVYGFLSERLFNVWIMHNKKNVFEMKVKYTDKRKLSSKLALIMGEFKLLCESIFFYKERKYMISEMEDE